LELKPRNLLGSRLLMRFLELLGPGVGLEHLGNGRPQGSHGSEFWLGLEVLRFTKSGTLEGVGGGDFLKPQQEFLLFILGKGLGLVPM
jgi:hypothetical protein